MKIFSLVFLLFLTSLAVAQKKYFFQNIQPEHSGIYFNNRLEVNEDKFFDYNYYGNSSGVGVGDFNNDGKTDIFFSANRVDCKLYLNEGDFRFKDITGIAGVAGNGNWGTGVSVVDINGDGLLDIYISHSGYYNYADSNKLCNELFVNLGTDKNGVPHFREMAHAYGLDLPGSQTTQVVFFDYDHDGDLDAFVLNHARTRYVVLYDAAYFQKNPNKNFANALLRNDNGHFTDVTKSAGISRSNINFGLGVTVSDVNNDGWPDLYCTSDFEERDCFYLNQHDGTFKEVLTSGMRHISQFSMGVDIADINNDGLMDLMTVDMKPLSNYRQKLIISQDNDDKLRNLVKLGFYTQYPRNMLQVNQGIDQNGTPHFSEVGQIAGVSATDWSWSPLFVDLDNDGWKDLFITCGYAINDNMDAKNKYVTARSVDTVLLLHSQFFQNQKGDGFKNMTGKWYEEKPLLSYAAAYADFDNDGKVDIVIANLNAPPTLLQNTGSRGNYLSVKLKGKGMNHFAIGSKVFVSDGDQQQVQELEPVRGYQASQDYILHFGLNENKTATIKVIWPDGSMSVLQDQHCNQLIELDQQNAVPGVSVKNVQPLYKQIPLPGAATFISKQNEHPDFKYQFTLPYKISDAGQVVAVGDINQDGLMDYYIGGEAGSEKFFLLGTEDGLFKKLDPACFQQTDDNMAALLADLDHDGKPDLITISRKGRILQPQVYDKDTAYVYRLYQNMGNGNFKEIENALPRISTPARVIAAGDLDNDNDLDLFIGGYTTQMNFGKAGPSYIFRNDSKPGHFIFTNITNTIFPSANLGMITSAEWTDMDQDHFPELMITGEWMNCRLFKNKNGKLADISKQAGLSGKKGLWSLITAIDVDGDGKLDLVAGNAGLNNTFTADSLHPLKLQLLGFDGAPSIPVITCFYEDNKEYPMYFRDEMLSAVQSLRKVFVTYDSYGRTDINALISSSHAKRDTVLTCNTLASGVFMNDGHGHFNFAAFPSGAQVSRINAVARSQKKELVTGGNFFGYRTQFGAADAMPLIVLANHGKKWESLGPSLTGLFSTGQVSKLIIYAYHDKERMLVFRKNESPQLFETDTP